MHPFLILTVRLILAVMWLIASIAKLRERDDNAEAILAFGLLPDAWLRRLGKALPWMELTLGTLLLVGAEMRFAAWCSAGLLALFSIAIIVNLLRGRKIECHCFGQMDRGKISWRTVGRNLSLLAASGILAATPVAYWSVDAIRSEIVPPTGTPPLVDYAPILLSLIAVVLFLQMAAAAWSVMQAILHAEDGPAMDIPERAYLRRWAGLDRETPASEADGK